MRLAAPGLALLLLTACSSQESPAAPDLTVHQAVASAERGTDRLTKPVEPNEESVVVADTKLLRIGPAALSAPDYAEADVVSDGTGVEVVDIRLTADGRRAYTELTAKAACHPVGDPRRTLVFVHAGRVVSSASLATSVECGVGITGGRLGVTPHEAPVTAEVVANGE